MSNGKFVLTVWIICKASPSPDFQSWIASQRKKGKKTFEITGKKILNVNKLNIISINIKIRIKKGFLIKNKKKHHILKLQTHWSICGNGNWCNVLYNTQNSAIYNNIEANEV